MNEIEKAIEHFQGQNKYYASENDEYSKKCIAVNNIAIKALEEKLETDGLIQEYDTNCTAKDIVESFIKYVKAEDNELAGFRVLTNADKEDYESWKQEKQSHECRHGCDYCCGEANDRQVLIQPTCEEDDDIYINIYNEISSVDGVRGKKLNFCPMCGRKLEDIG